MSFYGKRYLTTSNFKSFFGELKISSPPNDNELELYEKEGLLLPAARIVRPDEYVLKRHKTDQQNDTYGQKLIEWSELENLFFNTNTFNAWNLFDYEFANKNKFLQHPTISDSVPWDSYKVKVKSRSGDEYNVSTVEHYYHYYQAYQTYEIQSKYPVFSKNYWLLQNLNKEVKDRVFFMKPQCCDQIYEYLGDFDALSFFIELYRNEEKNLYSRINKNDGIRKVNKQQKDYFEKQIEKHTTLVFNKFNLKHKQLYKFLIVILEKIRDYEASERFALANSLKNDAIFLSRFIYYKTNKSIQEIEDCIGSQASLFVRKQFRYLDRALEIYDYAQETFERVSNEYNQDFPNQAINKLEIDQLFKFIEKKKLFIIPYAIYDIDEVLNNANRFHYTSLYIGLSNFVLGFECFLREIISIVNNNWIITPKKIKTDTLFPMIRDLFRQEWGSTLQLEHDKRKNSHTSNIAYIEDVYTCPSLDHLLKVFLITYSVRNFSHHMYSMDPYFFQNLYSIAYKSICYSFLYSWKYALQKGWISLNTP